MYGTACSAVVAAAVVVVVVAAAAAVVAVVVAVTAVVAVVAVRAVILTGSFPLVDPFELEGRKMVEVNDNGTIDPTNPWCWGRYSSRVVG